MSTMMTILWIMSLKANLVKVRLLKISFSGNYWKRDFFVAMYPKKLPVAGLVGFIWCFT